jgi:hypothetical protein
LGKWEIGLTKIPSVGSLSLITVGVKCINPSEVLHGCRPTVL